MCTILISVSGGNVESWGGEGAADYSKRIYLNMCTLYNGKLKVKGKGISLT